MSKAIFQMRADEFFSTITNNLEASIGCGISEGEITIDAFNSTFPDIAIPDNVNCREDDTKLDSFWLWFMNLDITHPNYI